MLKKKSWVTKSIRFEEKISDDLTILSKILDRTQNELVNIAVENLLKSNSAWFAQNIIVDFFKCDIDNGIEPKDMFEADNITVKVKYINDDVVVYVKLPDEQFSKTFADNDVEGYEKYLRELALCYVDFNTAYVKSYLEDRLNYQ